VLSNPITRGFYDLYGEFGLKNGGAEESNAFTGGYRFSGDPHRVYATFFATDNPFATEMYGCTSAATMFGFSKGGFNSKPRDPPKDLVVDLACTLTEIYNGCSKTVAYTK
jgi:DnaJ family protein B protein 13